MRLQCWKRSGRNLLLSAFAIHLWVSLGSQMARSADEGIHLQLEVLINGTPVNMISSFVLYKGGTIGAEASELQELGLVVGDGAPARTVLMNEIPTLKYDYDERSQKILITVDDAYRVRRTFDLNNASVAKTPPAPSNWAAVVNYNLQSTADFKEFQTELIWPTGTALTLDAHALSPYGSLSQSALLLTRQDNSTEVMRLDTSYRNSDQHELLSWRVGDSINSGLSWTRSIRIGGVQAQRDYSLRPDLVTMPLPNLTGTAAVPSTIDVYVNSIRTFSQEVPAGPFGVSNIPLVTGAGDVQMVICDLSGQETKTTLPFYASASLLAPGLNSWSLEGGLPRISYGSGSDAYIETPVASASWRHGIYDWLTVDLMPKQAAASQTAAPVWPSGQGHGWGYGGSHLREQPVRPKRTSGLRLLRRPTVRFELQCSRAAHLR